MARGDDKVRVHLTELLDVESGVVEHGTPADRVFVTVALDVIDLDGHHGQEIITMGLTDEDATMLRDKVAGIIGEGKGKL